MKKKKISITEHLYHFFHNPFWKKSLIAQIFLLIAVFFLIFLIRVLLQKQEYVTVKLMVSGGEWWWYSSGPPQWLVDPVGKGAKEYDAAGKVVVEVLDVQTYTFNQQRTQAQMSGPATSEKTSIITARLAVTKQRGSGQYRFRREPLQVGVAMYIAPNNTRINCNVLGIEGNEGFQYIEKTVVIKDYDVYPWRAEAYFVGTKMLDSEGKTLAEIIDKKVMPTLVYTNDQWGNLYAKESPIKVNVELTVRLQATTSQGDLYFLFQPLRIGMPLEIPFSNVITNDPKIINIE